MISLAPPRIRDLEVFTRLPNKYGRGDVSSPWADANRAGEPTHSFLEGPVFDAAGNLYVTDIPWGRIFRVDAAGSWDLVVEYDGEPNGMKFLNERTLLIADYKHGLMALDVQSAELRPHLSRRNTERFRGLNDLVFDKAGNLYFTDQGQTGMQDPTGRVYRLAPDGRLDLLLDNIPSPNGIALSPDERILYIAATRGNCVWRAPLMRDGNVSKVGIFFSVNGPAGPDGLAVNAKGQLLIASSGLGVVWLIDRFGQPAEMLRSSVGPLLTNIAFGGASRKTLYCTESESGTILRTAMDDAGADMPRGVER